MTASPFPEQLLREQLAGSAYRGTFESHITIEAADADGREHFRSACRQLGVKCVLIELPEGASRSQPMTACYHHGEIGSVAEEVASHCRTLRAAGFSLVRIKLEAVAANEGGPDSDEEGARATAANYFEFHVKLLLAADSDLDVLRACCERYGARLSRNAFKWEEDGRSERFVTMRLYRIGRQSALGRLDALEKELTSAGFVIVNRQKEYTIFDSAESLDAGWLEAPGRAGAGS
jgi:hypothetical protein